VGETDDARSFMSHIINFNGTDSPFVRVFIGCSGVFIAENFVLTAASCVNEFNVTAMDPRFSIGSNVTNVYLGGSGILFTPLQVHTHPKFDPEIPLENNIAIVEVNRIRSGILKPRELGGITSSRFYTMMGWEGFQITSNTIPLQMFAVSMVNSSSCAGDVYCTRGTMTSSIEKCGGLQGAPVFDEIDKVAGIVVRDNFCQESSTVGGSFISVEDYKEWIEEVTSMGIKTSSTLLTLVGAILITFMT
jgi:secreted trypsin-like serine protease